MEFVNNELKKLNYVRTSESLNNLDVNCSKLLRKLIKKGDIFQNETNGTFFSLSNSAVSEFSYYKNSAAFAFAPFFSLLFEGTGNHEFVSEYLEIAIMGYTKQMKPSQISDPLTYPDWFHSLLKKFFIEKFILLKKLLLIIQTKESLFEKELTHTALVEAVFKDLTTDAGHISKDEIFEIIFFLEKKSILTNNLSDFNIGLAENYISKAEEIVELLES
jgi:hypothetical protein